MLCRSLEMACIHPLGHEYDVFIIFIVMGVVTLMAS